MLGIRQSKLIWCWKRQDIEEIQKLKLVNDLSDEAFEAVQFLQLNQIKFEIQDTKIFVE